MLRETLHNLSTARPQALGEMLDSVQADDRVKAEPAEVEKNQPAPDTARTERPATPTLVKKEVLRAALAYLASPQDNSPSAMSPSSAPRVFQPQTPVLSQTVTPEARPASPTPAATQATRPAEHSPTSDTVRQTVVPRRETALTPSVPLFHDKPDPPAQTSSALTGRLFDSPARLMAALVADEQREIMMARFQYADTKERRIQEKAPLAPAATPQTHEEKPGTSLLTLTQKLLSVMRKEGELPGQSANDPHRPWLEKNEGVESRTFFWQRRDKSPRNDVLSRQDEDGEFQVNDAENKGPLWHPFAPVAPDASAQASAGLLAAVVVTLLATILVMTLLVINL